MVFYSSISCRQRFVSVRIRFDLVPRQTDNTPEHIAFRTFLRKIEKIKETENNWIKLQQKLLVGITIGYLFEIDWHTCLVSSQEKTNLNVYGKRSTKKNQPQSTVDTPNLASYNHKVKSSIHSVKRWRFWTSFRVIQWIWLKLNRLHCSTRSSSIRKTTQRHCSDCVILSVCQRVVC